MKMTYNSDSIRVETNQVELTIKKGQTSCNYIEFEIPTNSDKPIQWQEFPRECKFVEIILSHKEVVILYDAHLDYYPKLKDSILYAINVTGYFKSYQ